MLFGLLLVCKNHVLTKTTRKLHKIYIFQPQLKDLSAFLATSYTLRIVFGVGDSFTFISVYALALSAIPERQVSIVQKYRLFSQRFVFFNSGNNCHSRASEAISACQTFLALGFAIGLHSLTLILEILGSNVIVSGSFQALPLVPCCGPGAASASLLWSWAALGCSSQSLLEFLFPMQGGYGQWRWAQIMTRKNTRKNPLMTLPRKRQDSSMSGRPLR